MTPALVAEVVRLREGAEVSRLQLPVPSYGEARLWCPRAYEEIVDFIAAGTTPDEVARFQASQATKDKVERLIAKEKEPELTRDEASELAHYMQLEDVMRLAKARAKGRLNDELRHG